MRELIFLSCLSAVLLNGCATIPRNSEATELPPEDDGSLVVGMSTDEVTQTWGDTDCIFLKDVEGKSNEVWGYGLDPAHGEVVGIPDCAKMQVLLYFDSGMFVRWGEAE